ncbi:NAD-dependent epimerase/dehydratase family protein [Clostridium sp. BL-8]|uniref:NAD-dependent epimerase/dehydratase family protein n=1 Tax=Clostridium sp. BL-8 TaxID=349938 RepID=UPI00098C0D48|nr:NAD-dependent epimerase/dehydratase family protein [Clostridium sp. BL-8]OOM80321.1 dTDP-glucose 4,6-dehydratase [Clostridium sp. BL-8]
MKLIDNGLYNEDIKYVATLSYPWEMIKNKIIMVSGANGMIGSFLIDVLMYRNKEYCDNCSIVALGRDMDKAKDRFGYCWNDDKFSFIVQDINKHFKNENLEDIDFIIHAASNTHPVAYATDPIGTVTTNIIGTYNLLKFASTHRTERFIFTSSVEVYGENRGDVERFTEDYCGYIDCNTLRAGYSESKRAGEALCQAFIKQHELDIVISRLSRTYGPTMLKSDTKAISQFIKKGIAKEDIVLKSEGTQFYSYSYVADAVSGILAALFNGKRGEAYNISDKGSDISLCDLAQLIADYVGKKVVFEMPDTTERAGYSKATKAVLNSGKLQKIGWKAKYSIKQGIERTIDLLSES